MARPTSRVSRVLMTGPLAPFADAYRAELCERGYAPLSTVSELRQVARFSRWLEARLPEGVHSNQWAKRLRIARGFAGYLQTIDPATEIPPPDVFPVRRQRAT